MNDEKLLKEILNILILIGLFQIGYRINSKQATQFRIWATNILKNYLTEGYVINESKVFKLKNKFEDLQNTIDSEELYPDLKSKSSHLLYFIIKDQPFSDGNKRIASFLFVYFLEKNNYLHKQTGENKVNDNALTTLALLIAESHPKEKEIMIRLIKNILG